MEKQGIKWKTVMVYSPMSNDRAERMVRTIKTSLRNMVLGDARDWEEAIPSVLYGYRRRRFSSGCRCLS